ncbi:MAG: hypothetical protein M3Q89_13845 [Verrucomicrobiota bacterium]|nr:hypothetical protein [Verrucomicrobiota bacterium]
MLAQVRKLSCPRASRLILMACGAFAFGSCATKQEPQLISDTTGRESTMPWNQQEKWENRGQLGSMAERFETR